MNAKRVASNTDLLQAFVDLRAEAKTYNYGRSTIQTGIKSILGDSRYRVIVDDVQAQTPNQRDPVSSIAYRFVSSKRFNHKELSRLLQVDDDELATLLSHLHSGAVSVFN